jgi:eukaryotic-like serine/threonine-protein kinase
VAGSSVNLALRNAAETEPDPLATVAGPRPRSHRRPSAPIEPGERYEVGPTMARGGMGEVIAAYDLQIGREVAIKRLHAAEPSAVALRRFLREARIQGRLDHPAIVPVHELANDAEGRPYFVMKKLAGTTLADILDDPAIGARFTRQRLLRAFADVCLAVEYAHTRGVTHRDLKPSNIVLGEFGEVYVLDWGIAHVEGDPDDTPAAVIGTPGYMSPEQVRCERIDARSDVYALGCVLFEILTGEMLHPRGRAGLKSAIAGADARASHRAGGRDIAPELDLLCVRATAPRALRIDTARELGDGVQHYLDGDRDHALRANLARAHLDRASAALATGDDEERRAIAMREAGQALALEPTLEPAAQLVGRLMLEPPRVTPRAVETELAAVDTLAIRRHALIAVFAHLGYVAVAPILWLIGVHDAGYLGALAACGTIAAVGGALELRTGRVLAPVVIACDLAIIILFARMFTPFLVAPAIGAVTVMATAFHPSAARLRVMIVVALLSIAAILGTWLAEVVGIVVPTMRTYDGKIELASPLDGIRALPPAPALACFVVALFAVAAVLAVRVARSERAARHHLHVQAWQLRQLLAVPRPEVSESGAASRSRDPARCR